MNIKVNDILDLILCCAVIQIGVNGDIYEFPIYKLPDEIKHTTISTIDDPYYAEKPHALCINVDRDNFNDYNAFKKENKEYLV